VGPAPRALTTSSASRLSNYRASGAHNYFCNRFPEAYCEIVVFLRGHPGAVCSERIATALALPLRQVAITTLGLDNREGFVMVPDEPCSRRRTRRRVIGTVADKAP
jgi:hypothetical protein